MSPYLYFSNLFDEHVDLVVHWVHFIHGLSGCLSPVEHEVDALLEILHGDVQGLDTTFEVDDADTEFLITFNE